MSIKVGDKVVVKEEIYNSFDPSFIFKDIFNRENMEEWLIQELIKSFRYR